ncbi:MAG TPA: hypothetical protein VFT13_03355 [Candidatus Krumholzibacteria bacterium]|nr:hypothetical protein [Candidatus Krumholzibacteria bacterium]
MSLLTPLLFAVAVAQPAPSSSTCAAQSLLPAYAHNDYRNARPLGDALALGYRGVEVDLLRADETLLVGHDRDEVQATRTLARLYLDPLRDHLRRCGHVLPDSTPFLVNIELKEHDERAFRLLLDELDAYPELFRPAAAGMPPPVRVVLVGWWPAPGANQRPWPEYVGVQLVPGDTNTSRADTTGRPIALITIAYGQGFTRTGRGGVPAKSRAALAEGRRLAAAFGVPLRVHHAPATLVVYQWLLSEGVTLVGATDLARSRDLLVQLPDGRLKATGTGFED